ncbi:hypothetical protein [Planomicrobium okeanokoites]|uniref:hypothetical protein n=1 Tax=Planomicrobium okeanokoites TaxID=244 RepID=UPI002492ACDB|nr:hypothetical protein [Planomicrobium okeanokoites]
MIEYYLDGSAKGNMVGAGVVKINEYGFIEKSHFTSEHVNPSSQTAEGFALEKALGLIMETDIHKNELINIYTDCRQLINLMDFNQTLEFHHHEFFNRQEANNYFQYLREIYKELILRNSKSSIYHCAKTNTARPLIKVFFKDDADHKNYLQDAHKLSRTYIRKEEGKVEKVELTTVVKEVPKRKKVELKAVKKANSWHIVKNNGKTIAVNKRPLIALSVALVQTKNPNQQIKLCLYLENLLKSTNKNKVNNESMLEAIKIIDEHKKMFVS